mgnify:CR=1 FL=1
MRHTLAYLSYMVKRDWRKIVICNILYFGAFAASSVFVGLYAMELHEELMKILGAALERDPLLSTAARAYFSRRPLEAFLVTLAVNTLLGALVTVTLSGAFFMTVPSALYRAILWGVMLPVTVEKYYIALPTLLLEGEGYVLAMVPGLNLSLAVLRPERYDAETRLRALRNALREALTYYVLITTVLAVAAIVEVITVFSLMGYQSPQLTT